MQIVADNDFAMFVGTSNSVDRLIYQNDKVWMDQLLNASVPFALQQGETTFFLLGMGGGGQENISGSVNGVDLTNIPDVAMSSDLGPSLTLFGTQSSGGGLVEAGFYNASILDVQAALPTVTWGGPTLNTTDTVVSRSPTGSGFHFDASTAHLFKFSAADVNITPTPEPSTFLLFTGAGVAIAFNRFRRRSNKS